MAAVRLTIKAHFCRKGTKTQTEEWIKATGYRPRDLDNLVAAMKPAIDGLVDAGLVQDDDKTRVRYGDHDITWVEAYEHERVEVLVEPLEQGGVG
jgi:Holliday junction resolvase RusA-like endonuclease